MFTTLMFTTCLLWNDDMKFYVFELREKDLTRVKVLPLRDATFINCWIHVQSNLFPLFLWRGVPVALSLPFSVFLFPGSFPFDWGCRQKTGVAPSTYLITFPSAKGWCLRFAIRKVSIIEGLLDDSLWRRFILWFQQQLREVTFRLQKQIWVNLRPIPCRALYLCWTIELTAFYKDCIHIPITGGFSSHHISENRKKVNRV